MESKEFLRKLVRQELKSWCAGPVKEREKTQLEFTEQLVKYLKQQQGTWAAFNGMLGEPSLEQAVGASPHLRWIYPRVENDALSFWEPQQEQAFIKGAYGILEPDPQLSQQMNLVDIDGVLIPGLAFDKAGARLGRGKAFYDKALQNYKGIKVGTGFSWQIQRAAIPTDSWDIFMDVLVTEKEILRFSSSGAKRS